MDPWYLFRWLAGVANLVHIYALNVALFQARHQSRGRSLLTAVGLNKLAR